MGAPVHIFVRKRRVLSVLNLITSTIKDKKEIKVKKNIKKTSA